jgi:hypothetical protein
MFIKINMVAGKVNLRNICNSCSFSVVVVSQAKWHLFSEDGNLDFSFREAFS